jgi:hypothetical protein
MTKLFINGCSFLTFRPKDKVNTHCGEELAKLMGIDVAINLAVGGRGNKRLLWTTRTWCEKFPEEAKDCFFLIGSSIGSRFDFPTSDNFKLHECPSIKTTWKTWDPNKGPETKQFIKYLFNKGMSLEQTTQIEKIITLLDLQDYFTIKKYPYVMYNTLSIDPITNEDIQFMFDKINKKRYFKPTTSHFDYTVKNNQHCKPRDPHPNTIGHKEWAIQLKEFIDANNLRTIQ